MSELNAQSKSSLKSKSRALASKSAIRNQSKLRVASKAVVRGEGYDEEAWLQQKDPVKPDNQLELNDEELGQELTRILRAENPHAPDNIVRFSHKESAYRQMSSVEQCAFHFSLNGAMVHKESDEARRQLAKNKFKRMTSKPEEAPAVTEEAGQTTEAPETPAAEGAEGNDEGVETEQEAQEAETKDSGTGTEENTDADGDKPLRNQFNYSERASQTYNYVMRERGTMTEAAARHNYSANATQWAMYDAYTADLARQAAAKDTKKKKAPEKEKRPQTAKLSLRDSEESASSWASAAKVVDQSVAKKMERLASQNTFDDVLQDFRYYDDPSDQYKDKEGSLLPLWRMTYDKARKRTVTCLEWSNHYSDLLYVGYGSYEFAKQVGGLVCVYSLKQPSYPEYVVSTPQGVMSLSVHPQHPSVLAVGMYNGDVAVYDLTKKDYNSPVVLSSAKTGKHTDPVWQIEWHHDDIDGNLNFTSVSSDGRVTSWTVIKTELQHTDIIRLALDHQAEEQAAEPLFGLGSGTCLAFHATEDRLFIVGTEEGDIHLCSKAYSSKFLGSYKGHSMAVYAVRWSPFHSDVFLSCSADWTVKLWVRGHEQAVLTFDLGNAVGDVFWAPYSSTVFAAITTDGMVHFFDLSLSKYEPITQQQVVKKSKLTHVAFNGENPMLALGDDRGGTTTMKLSPNLRKALKDKKLKEEGAQQAQLQKVIDSMK